MPLIVKDRYKKFGPLQATWLFPNREPGHRYRKTNRRLRSETPHRTRVEGGQNRKPRRAMDYPQAKPAPSSQAVALRDCSNLAAAAKVASRMARYSFAGSPFCALIEASAW